MKILNFIDDISNRVSRFNVLNTLDTEIIFLEDKIIPCVEKVIKTYPGDFSTNYAPFIAVSQGLAEKKPGKGFNPLLNILKTYLKQAKVLQKYSKNELGDENILKDALTYRTVSILQYVETLAFVARYTTRLVDGFLYSEYYNANKEHIKAPSAYHNNMNEWLIRNRHSYMFAMGIGILNEKEMVKDLDQIPDKVINVKNFDVDAKTAQYGVSTLDPLGFGLITGRYSIIYLARDMYERARNAINDSRKEDIVSIELRLVYLKETKNGRSDPNLENRLKQLEARKKKLHRAVQEFDTEED